MAFVKRGIRTGTLRHSFLNSFAALGLNSTANFLEAILNRLPTYGFALLKLASGMSNFPVKLWRGLKASFSEQKLVVLSGNDYHWFINGYSFRNYIMAHCFTSGIEDSIFHGTSQGCVSKLVLRRT
jgi:hypothetical protein